MTKDNQMPWANGPGELLRHGLDLLKKDGDTNRRLAMISIDNAVELMIKTYLGLPKRVTGLSISRKEFQDISESFPAMLDALETYAADKLDGINLGEVEWYHRLRNQLYHQGNGLTVEKDKVEVYTELANILFQRLFGQELVREYPGRAELLGEFMSVWIDMERDIHEARVKLHVPIGAPMVVEQRLLQRMGMNDIRDFNELMELQRLRNQIVHGMGNWEKQITPELIQKVRDLTKRLNPDAIKNS